MATPDINTMAVSESLNHLFPRLILPGLTSGITSSSQVSLVLPSEPRGCPHANHEFIFNVTKLIMVDFFLNYDEVAQVPGLKAAIPGQPG